MTLPADLAAGDIVVEPIDIGVGAKVVLWRGIRVVDLEGAVNPLDCENVLCVCGCVHDYTPKLRRLNSAMEPVSAFSLKPGIPG